MLFFLPLLSNLAKAHPILSVFQNLKLHYRAGHKSLETGKNLTQLI